jgi:hypothetical protein
MHKQAEWSCPGDGNFGIRGISEHVRGACWGRLLVIVADTSGLYMSRACKYNMLSIDIVSLLLMNSRNRLNESQYESILSQYCQY